MFPALAAGEVSGRAKPPLVKSVDFYWSDLYPQGFSDPAVEEQGQHYTEK